MRGYFLERILAGTALGLVVMLAPPAGAQTTMSEKEIQSAIPVPEPAGVPPLTAADVVQDVKPAPAAAAQTAPAESPADREKRIQAAIPVPEPANVPPITASDLNKGAPAATATPATASVPEGKDAAPASVASAPAAAPETVDIKSLTGKDLVKAPLAANLSPSDTAVAEKLREQLAGKVERLFTRKGERDAVEAFYRDRGFAPLWVNNDAPSARASSAIAYLRGVDADGLEPSEYPAPTFANTDAEALAQAELKYTDTVLTFAHHASMGRVHWSRVSGDIGYKHEEPSPEEILASLLKATTVAEALGKFLPQHAAYKALKEELAEVRQKSEKPREIVRVPEGPTLKPGMSDPRVALLRQRLKIAGDQASETFDEAVTEAVKDYQDSAGLRPDGLVGPATLRALNGVPKRERTEDIIIANLERWRWMPHDLGGTYSILNIPDYTLRLIRDNKLYWSTKVVVGKPSQPTPIMSAEMKYITVNPTWNVPPSIIANEYIPAMQQDPTVLERMGLKVSQNPDGTIRIYQPPGAGNALGRIRFNFPNKFLVYQHDTPDKHLFARDKRAYSHGCMRVQDPLMYGEKLLSIARPSENYTVAKLRSMFGGSEINIDFPVNLPVHLTYQTAFVDDTGQLQIRDDVYGRDQRLLQIIKGDERRVADVAVPRSHTGSGISREALRYDVRGDGYAAAEFFNPFAALFGGPRSYDRPPAPIRGQRRGDPRLQPNFFERIFR